MLRALILFFLTSILIAADASEKRFMIQGEYRTDNIEYDEREKSFLRIKMESYFSGKSGLHFALLCPLETESVWYSWNIELGDLSEKFKIFFGNYYACFGSGLSVGKKNYFSPDLYSKREISYEKKTFIADKSGFPQYSFQGIFSEIYFHFSGFDITVALFYSIRNRYINNDYYDKNGVASSAGSLLTKNKSEGNFTQPALMHDSGLSLKLAIDHFLFQAYGLCSYIEAGNGETVSSEASSSGYSFPVSSFYLFGISGIYSDRFISIKVDYTITGANLKENKSIGIKKYGLGFLYDIKLAGEIFQFCISGIYTDNSFFAPYSSFIKQGEDFHGGGLSIKPLEKIKIGCDVQTERKRIFSISSHFLESASREEIYSVFGGEEHSYFKSAFSRLEKYYQGSREVDRRISAKASILLDNLRWSAFSICTLSTASPAAFSAWTIVEKYFGRIFKGHLQYAFYKAEPDNSIYVYSYGIADSISGGFFIKRHSHLVSGGIDYKSETIIISANYENQFYSGKSLRKRGIFGARCYF